MTTAHRRVLKPDDARCHPSPHCQLQHTCARFTSPMPQGIGGKMGNFRSAAPVVTYCSDHLSQMVDDAELEAAAKPATKPPIGGKR